MPISSLLALELPPKGSGLVTKSCPTLVTPWSVACQAPLSTGFSSQEYWNGLLFLPPGDLHNPGIEAGSPALQADSLPTELPNKPSEYHPPTECKGDGRGWDGWMASPNRWTWVWVNSRSWWWTGRPVCCDSWGHKESDTTKRLNWINAD